MAFILHSQRPKDPRIGKRFFVNKEVSNLAGVFEKNTVLKCIEVRNGGGVLFADEEGNNLLLNECCIPNRISPL